MMIMVWVLCLCSHMMYGAQAVPLSQEETNAILTSSKPFAYIGSLANSLQTDIPLMQQYMKPQSITAEHVDILATYISEGKSTAPVHVVAAALQELLDYLATNPELPERNRILTNTQAYAQLLNEGLVDIQVINQEHPDATKGTSCKSYCQLKVCSLNAEKLCAWDAALQRLTVCSNATIGGNLRVNRNVTIGGDLTVEGTINGTISPTFLTDINLIGTPQQRCILFLDQNLNEKARICSSSIPGDNGIFVSVDEGATQNFRVNDAGGVDIAAPSSGAALDVTGNSGAPAIIARGNGTATAPALQLVNNPPGAAPPDNFLTVNASGIVRETTLTLADAIVNGCQPGPLEIGTSDATSLTLATNGCTDRVTIAATGAVSIAMPSAGEALTVNGNIVVPQANAAETQGLIKLGGTTETTNVKLYEIGTRNFFSGNGTVNSTVTGTDNISIGSSANSSLTTSNNTIAIGLNATTGAADNDSIVIGNQATTTAARTIVIGSTDSTNTGPAPTATATNGIAIGSGSGTMSGAIASGLSSVSIGPSGGVFDGSLASGTHSIALGVNSMATDEQTIAIGSTSGNAAGFGPMATNDNAVAVGSASGANAAPVATGISAIAIGSADGSTFVGASATGDRSIALGYNAESNSALTISLGSSSGAASGLGPRASNINAIAIGTANGARDAALATGVSSIAIGSPGPVAIGAVASDNRAIALGLNATASAATSIAVGSASGTAGGTGPVASNTNAIAVGSANAAHQTVQATGTYAISIGSATSTHDGSTTSGDRAISLGNNANATATGAICVGSASGVAGGTGPRSTNSRTIAIGSAHTTMVGPSASGVNGIAIGSALSAMDGANATGNRSIAIGVNANASGAASESSIVAGSASTGAIGPTTTNRAAIAIGSAQDTQRGARGGNISSIAIGSANSTFPAAAALGSRTIAIGTDANSSVAASIMIGSASAAAGGLGPVGSATNSIAIGSANDGLRGALASAGGAIALGGSDGTSAGASATGARSVAIGTGSTATTADQIVLGNVAVGTVQVGVGTTTPGAKLDIVGTAGTPVLQLTQGSTAIGSAPSWLTPSTSAVAGTPIHYNAANQLFGFTSSERYKTNIHSIDNESEIIYKLNPVMYDARTGHGEGTAIPGFIAEQVYEVAPNLTMLNSNNDPEMISYDALVAYMIKELQHHKRDLGKATHSLAEQHSVLTSLLHNASTLKEQWSLYKQRKETTNLN